MEIYSLTFVGILSAFAEKLNKKVQKTGRITTQQIGSFEPCLLASEMLIHGKVALEAGMNVDTTALCQFPRCFERPNPHVVTQESVPTDITCNDSLAHAYLSSCWPDRRAGSNMGASQLLSCRQIFGALRC